MPELDVHRDGLGRPGRAQGQVDRKREDAGGRHEVRQQHPDLRSKRTLKVKLLQDNFWSKQGATQPRQGLNKAGTLL